MTASATSERAAVNANPPQVPDPDKAAAHQFLSELNTRIATQPLPYQDGVEARALESLWEIFGQAREAMKKYPGCKAFAAAVTKMLNEDLRPFTAKWHRAHQEGILNSRDGADEFRGELAEVQRILREFAGTLEIMAYGEKFPELRARPVMAPEELDKLLADLAFGLGEHPLIPPETIAAINAAEANEVRTRRSHRGHAAPDRTNAVGLGLSGGGIRSATFCLGVVQVLAARGLLKEVDFLSTVSGGGYTGSFLTSRLGNNEPYADVAGPHGPDPGPIRYLRFHAKYLTVVDLWDSWSMVTATLAGMILNWSAPVLLVVLAALAAHGLAQVGAASWWKIAFAGSGLLTIAALLLYGILMRKGQGAARFGGDLLGWLAAATVLVGAGWMIAVYYEVIPDWIKSHWLSFGSVAVAGPAVLRFIPVLKTPSVRRITLTALLWIAGLIIPLGSLALFLVFYRLADQELGVAILGVLAIVLAIVAFAILNINLTAPHRLYRDRLAATFIQKEPAGAATIPLTEINPGSSAPYHLINTALNLPSSEEPALRDRKCDFFLFSKHWCGSPIVGYRESAQWRTNGAPTDLATAMAVSGAAVSSYMGLGSMPSLTALLTFLNVRLGFWIRKPAHGTGSENLRIPVSGPRNVRHPDVRGQGLAQPFGRRTHREHGRLRAVAPPLQVHHLRRWRG